MPTKATYLQPSPVQLVDIQDYHQELTMSLASARAIAAKAMRAAQKRYKVQYDTKSNHVEYHVENWVLVRFPTDENGRMRKLSQPWHGPYHVTALREPISVTKVYQPKYPGINVHQSRVKPCPFHFPASFYWFGGNSKGPGRLPMWVEQLLEENSTQCDVTSDTKGVNSNAENVHDEDDDIPEELTDTEESDDITNCEVETGAMTKGYQSLRFYLL